MIADLERAGFVLDRTKGSHRQFVHRRHKGPVTVSGNLGQDAKSYQERQVAAAIEETTQ